MRDSPFSGDGGQSDAGAMTKRMRRGDRPRGEAFVWITGLGLALSLALVLLLLGKVVSEGLAVFWPKRVEVFTLLPAGEAVGKPAGEKPAATTLVAGKVVQRKERRDLTAGRTLREIQIFAGNKEVYEDRNFRYIDEERIVARAQPADIVVLERMEYGDAIGFPVELRIKDRPAIPATAADFDQELTRLIAEGNDRREQILVLEKDRIGKLSRRLDGLRLKRIRASPAEQAAIDREIAEADSASTSLAAEAKLLRAQQGDNQLVMRLASGEERTNPIGQIIDWHRPNAISWFARVGRMTHNLVGFLWNNPREANTEGGIFPAIFGTFFMTILMSMAVMPFGVVAAIYLREYAKQGPLVRAVRIAVNNLAGVPSIVFGVFGLGFFVYFLGGNLDSLLFAERQSAGTPTFGTGGVIWAALTLALMTVPVVIVATEEAISAVPRGMKEGSLATGASKWQTIQRIVLPASAPGIITGLILAMARGAGEVAPLMLVGVVKLAPGLAIDGIWKDTDLVPFVHLDQKFMHLGFHIYDLSCQSPDSEAAKPMVFATTLFLIGLVVALNLGAILIREKLRRKFKTSAF